MQDGLRYWVRVEDASLSTAEDIDAFDDLADALAALQAIVASPDPQWGSVYLVCASIHGDEEWDVIASHYLPSLSDEDVRGD